MDGCLETLQNTKIIEKQKSRYKQNTNVKTVCIRLKWYEHL